ncbi:probable serine/threonine-protein kinase PBL18 isoform X1 [Primulina huaijiensis]|uniref:probable serine/threonine-protein kinase PBL18 isoform X1 n=1 Tax=Primulina huaijiensis TaxID=1492673 RepID=UPI003CC6EE4B
MGNCIQRNKKVVKEYDDGTINSHEVKGNSSEGRNQENVEIENNSTNLHDINLSNTDSSQGLKKVAESDYNFEMGSHNKIPSNRPSFSVYFSVNMEQTHQKSHPLPTPNLPQQPRNKNPKVSCSLLPTPDTIPRLEKPSCSSAIPNSETLMENGKFIKLPMPRSESEILSSPYLKAFKFNELKNATSNFHKENLLGEGGFGRVYKGWLDEETFTAARPGSGMEVAIKMLIPQGFQGHKEWLSEVNYLGRLRHPNLVKLVGYSLEGEDRILVYEFMPGGSLENHLFKKNSPPLSWATRIKVAAAAARGLCFLHDSESPVIYRDFKTSNILLDSEFHAKLSDFGLAKSGPTGFNTHVTTRVMGTEGYCDPKYQTTGKLTVKCDVYSFGVVLLELLTGRRAIDETKCDEEKNLVHWVRLHVRDNGKVFRVMDTKLEGQYPKRGAYVAANLALCCVNLEPKYRPPMTEILEILENLPSQKHHSNASP